MGFGQLVRRERRPRYADAELAVCAYDNRGTDDWYTENTGHVGSPYKVRIADANGSALARNTIRGSRADIDVIVAFYGISCRPTYDCIERAVCIACECRVTDRGV